MSIIKEYVTALASLNGEAIATVRGDAAMLANWQRDGENVGLVWAALREHGHDEAAIKDLQRMVGRAVKPWWEDYKPDEAGQSDAFLFKHGDAWAYVTGLERWHGWNGTHWQPDENRRFRLTMGAMLDEVHSEAMERARELFKEAQEDADAFGEESDEAKDANKEASEAFANAMRWRKTDGRIHAVDNLCRDQRAVKSDQMNAGNLLNLANGTLNLNSYTLHDHKQGDMLTHCLPYAYDQAATCPRWLQFLGEVLVKEDGSTPDPELAALLQEFIGYALTTETRHETMLWMSGDGSNGKSTVIRTVNALLGPMALKMDFGALARPDASYYLAKLAGERVVFSFEAVTKTGEELLKQLVSGEPITARPIRGEPITILPVAKIIWAMNEKPSVNDKSDGFWRRLRLVPFHRKFADHEKDVHLADKLAAELPGILNWALAGLQRLRSNGRFTDAAAVSKAVTEYRTSQNVVALWLNERTTHGLPNKVQERLPDPHTRAHQAFQDYLQWSAATNRQFTMTETKFGTELGKLAKKEERRGGNVYLFGLLTDAKTGGAQAGADAAGDDAAGADAAGDDVVGADAAGDDDDGLASARMFGL